MTRSNIIKWLFVGGFIFVALFLLVKYVFSGTVVLPQFFLVGSIKIYYYGLILALAVLAAYYFGRRRLSTINLEVSDFDNIVLTIIITGFIGARLYHVFSSFEYYQSHWSQIFYVWNGGLSIFGAIIGAVLGVFFYQRYYLTSTSFLKLLDFLAPSVILGQIIGRFGNLFNYEIYGPPTNLPWKMFVPVQFRIPPFETFQFFHPLFLYESLAGLLILIILIKWLGIAKAGQTFTLWLGLYGLLRLSTEFLRIDSPYLFGIKQNLLTAGVMIIVSVVLFIKVTYESQSTQNY